MDNMQIIDCHQDIPLSIEKNFSNKKNCAGIIDDYEKDIVGIFASIFPYRIHGSPTDIINRKIESSNDKMKEYGKILDDFMCGS